MWSNLAKVVYKRTYARSDNGHIENWNQTLERVIRGHKENPGLPKGAFFENELELVAQMATDRKALPAGRGLWFSGSPAHPTIGGAALVNCWTFTSDDWMHFVLAQDLLMLGGGVGLSVEHKYVSKLPKIKKNVVILHKSTKDADFIVPDSRSGWCELTRRVLEAFFVTGKGFTYSTYCIRGYGEKIIGFGGTASGPIPLIAFIDKLCSILINREGKHLRPIDSLDMICSIGEMVVAGNIRRSSIIIIGDAWDKEYLTAKRWDLGPIPTQRAFANLSVVCDDIEDLHPLFWKTYEHGEPYGIVNIKNIRMYGRMGEKKKDTAVSVNPCVSGDTLILTKAGYSRIDSLVGKKVEIWNGFEWSEVTPKITGVNQPMLKVKFSDGRELKCTTYHKFHLAVGYRGDTEVKLAKDLVVGDKLIKHNFPIIKSGPSLQDAYTHGFVAADGSSNSKYIAIYSPKEMCIPRLSLIKIKWNAANSRFNATLKFPISNKEFVPIEYNLNSKLEWLSGLLDGDGCELKEGGVQLSSVSLEFLKRTQMLLSTLGVQSKLKKSQDVRVKLMPNHKGSNSLYPCQELFRLLVGAVQMQELRALGLNCSRLKLNRTPQRDASQFVKVEAVEDAHIDATVYCFTEDKRHLGVFNGILTGQCGEATLENAEPCNLQDLFLSNLKDEEEFKLAAKLMHRWGKRVTMEHYHNELNAEVIERNRRIGTGITGCLQSPLFNSRTLDAAYNEIQRENTTYSKLLNINESIRTTVVKPSGTLSLLGDCTPGIHAAYSRYYTRRVRFSANDKLIPLLRAAGHHMEPVQKFDGTLDHNTLVVDFYVATPEGTPCADEGFDTWKQLDTLLMAQKHWSDQSVSVTVYYKKNEIALIKDWLSNNLDKLKTISFLCHNDHGFKQAPLEAITKDQYEAKIALVKDVDVDAIGSGDLESMECEGGVCPIK